MWEILSTTQTTGVRPDVVSSVTAVTACAEDGRREKASELWEEIQSTGIKPNDVAYSSSTKFCGDYEQWEKI